MTLPRLIAWLAFSLPLSAIATGCGREGQAAQPANAVRATAGPADSQPADAQAATAAPAIGPNAPSLRASSGHEVQASGQPPTGGSTGLVAHPDNIQAGLPAQRPLRTITNPREHDPRAIEEGKQLFVSYNCSDCHGGEGSGGMGPSLQDGRWHFGGSAGEVYESISEGRPDGMPSWGGRIGDSQIWALVAYVRTLSAGKDVTTQTFEGAGTVARGGH